MNDIQILVAALPKLSPKSLDFAANLIAFYNKHGRLSDKQWYWVDKLATSATEAPQQSNTSQIGDVKGIIELFDTAKQHLKRPKIMVRVDERDLRLNIAGATARVPGSINVCSAEIGDDGSRHWYGRITREGEFQPSRKYDESTQTAIANALKALANDPQNAAKSYGYETCHCCFCGIELTDDRSTKMGYGPICAKHYGLPWGD